MEKLFTRRKLLRRSALAAPALIIPGRSKAAPMWAGWMASSPSQPGFGAGFNAAFDGGTNGWGTTGSAGAPNTAITLSNIGNPAGDVLFGIWNTHAPEDFGGWDSITLGGVGCNFLGNSQSVHATNGGNRGVNFYYCQAAPANGTLVIDLSRTWTPFGCDVTVFSETGTIVYGLNVSGIGVNRANWATAQMAGNNLWLWDQPYFSSLQHLPQVSDPQALPLSGAPNCNVPSNFVGVCWIFGAVNPNPTTWGAPFNRIIAAESYENSTHFGSQTLSLATCTSIGAVTALATGNGANVWSGNCAGMVMLTVGPPGSPVPPTAMVALTSSPNPSVHLTSVLYTATVTGTGPTPTGTVTFADMDRAAAAVFGTSTLSGGVATLSDASLSATSALGQQAGPPGRHNIGAFYSGDANYAPARALNLQLVT